MQSICPEIGIISFSKTTVRIELFKEVSDDEAN